MEAKLIEGKTYQFKVIKKIAIADEDEKWILEDPFGYRLMIDTNFYQNYNIHAQTQIDCIVDKINCSGKLFLEPIHPYYKKMEVYQFEVVEQKIEKNIWGKPINVVIMKDIYNQMIECYINHQFIDLPLTLSCKIIQIKKGKPILIPVDNNYLITNKNYNLGEIYSFNIIEKNYKPHFKRFFILEDSFKDKHLLPMKPYPSYNLEVGQKIECIVYKINQDGELVLEPLHPFYIIGNTYSFQIKEIETRSIENQENEIVFTVYDIYNNECFLFVENIQKTDFKSLQQIECKVIGFKKGKPILQFNSLPSL